MKDIPSSDKQQSPLDHTFESLDELADYISEIFECPITIEDANHHVLAYSKHRKNVDEARLATIMNRKVPDNVINGLWKNNVMIKLIDSDEPVFVPEMKEIGLSNRVAISIWNKNEVLGFIWTHTGDKKLSPEKLTLLKESGKQVKKLLLIHQPGKRKSQEAYRDFFWKLLTEEMTDLQEIKENARQFNVKLEGKLAVVIFRFFHDITEQMEKHACYLTETQKQAQIVFRLFAENELILLIRLTQDHDSTSKIHAFIQQFTEKMSKQLQLPEINGSSSSLYENPTHLKDAYQEAIQTMQLKEVFPDELQHTFLYEDLGIFQFLDDLHTFWIQRQRKNKYIQKLREHDQNHRGALLITLHAFLQADSNIHRAAKKLFIHPNTMNYRLKRIKEVSGLDLKDPKQKTAVYLELLLENMYE